MAYRSNLGDKLKRLARTEKANFVYDCNHLPGSATSEDTIVWLERIASLKGILEADKGKEKHWFDETQRSELLKTLEDRATMLFFGDLNPIYGEMCQKVDEWNAAPKNLEERGSYMGVLKPSLIQWITSAKSQVNYILYVAPTLYVPERASGVALYNSLDGYLEMVADNQELEIPTIEGLTRRT